MSSQRVGVVLGTRPEIVKLAGVLDGLGDRAVLVHTGQHYDTELSEVFLTGLGVRPPAFQLALGGISRAEQVGRGVAQVAGALSAARVDVVVVQGDTNSALAGALAANCLDLPLVHVEAGLRSYDRAMPEEHNRVLVDHLSNLLAAPTTTSAANLAAEGIDHRTVAVTGNTVVEAVHRQLPGVAVRRATRTRLGLDTPYVLATIHRPENTDDPDRLRLVLAQLAAIPVPVLFPMHPRTRAAVERAGALADLDRLHVTGPVGGPEFLGLAADAALLVSDSGGVQEEATVLRRPLLVVRRSTERPEASAFARLVAPADITAAARDVLDRREEFEPVPAAASTPFGDGTASHQIVALINERF